MIQRKILYNVKLQHIISTLKFFLEFVDVCSFFLLCPILKFEKTHTKKNKIFVEKILVSHLY